MKIKCLAVVVALASGSLFLASCASSGKSNSPEESQAGLDAYQNAGGRLVQRGSSSLPSGADVNVSVTATGIASDEDIIWAPEDDNVPMPGGLSELWEQPENKSWNTSYVEAMRLARQSGRPLLIWFTDTAHSPLCRKLSDELFSNGGFDAWAMKRVVRLRVDSSIPHKERNEDIGVRKLKYIQKLKKRYKVSGHPTVLILSPRGAVVARYRGYKKDSSDYYWGRMKGDVNKAEDDYGAWREKLEKRGYRLWTSRSGRKTFAKLHRFKPGKVTLIDPDGKRGTTSFRKLSDADQAWVMLQKKKYEARQKR